MVRINDDYLVSVDEGNYTLCLDNHRTRNVKGVEVPVLKVIGYYSSLSAALKAYSSIKISDELSNGEFSISEACDIIKGCYKEMCDLMSSEMPL